MDINDYIEDGDSLTREYREKLKNIQTGDYLPDCDDRPLKTDDEFLEENSEAIPIESLDRVDEDIKQNFFGDKDGKIHLEFYEEREKQSEYDRFMSVLNGFVTSKMTNAYKKPIKEVHWSFSGSADGFPKWKWHRPDLRIEAKRIFDLWCCEFLKQRTMPISYMWSFLKSRLVIHGWTNRGCGRKKWDWSENQIKCSREHDGDFDFKSYIEENPIPAFEYSADWEKAEMVELNYLKAIEDLLMKKWNKQTKKSAPFININEWKKLCKLIEEWKKGRKANVTMFLEPNVHVVSKSISNDYTCWSSEIRCEVSFDDNKSLIFLKKQVIPMINFSHFTYDEYAKTITIWLTENINDEVYKAFEVHFEEYDENEPTDIEDITEKMIRGISEELDKFSTK